MYITYKILKRFLAYTMFVGYVAMFIVYHMFAQAAEFLYFDKRFICDCGLIRSLRQNFINILKVFCF